MFLRSGTSTSRSPTMAAREPSTIGTAPASFVSASGPRPRAMAQGMPWMLPDGLVSGVFMSPWASNQMRPTFCFLRAVVVRHAGDRPHRDRVVAAEHQRQAARGERLLHLVTQAFAGRLDLLQVLELRIADRLGLLDRHVDVAGVVHVKAQLGNALMKLGDAEGRRPHVHTAAAGAEVEGHADDGNSLAGHICRASYHAPQKPVNAAGSGAPM